MENNFEFLKREELGDIIRITHDVWYSTYEPILGIEQTDYMFKRIFNLQNLQNAFDKGEVFLVYSQEGEQKGFISYSPFKSQALKVHKLYVDSKHHKTGIGKVLLNKAEGIAAMMNKNAVILNVNRYNNALYFYKSQGYSIKEEVNIPIGPYEMNDYIMEKKLL